MFKKFLVSAMFVITLFGLGFFSSINSYANNSTPSTGVNNEDFMFDLGVITHKDIKESSWIKGGINFVFTRIITIMVTTVGAAAVLMMAIGGFMILASAGREDRVTKGKGMIWRAAMGLAFVLGAYVLVTTVQLLIKSIFSG